MNLLEPHLGQIGQERVGSIKLVKIIVDYIIFPLPKIRIVVDSGFKITAISFFLQTIGFSKVSFNGDIDKILQI